jgi:hypothetical protein
MTITSSGPLCDVCGNYVLLETLHFFSVTGIEAELCCHERCKQTLLDCGTEWGKLPAGPLRKAFEDATSKEE